MNKGRILYILTDESTTKEQKFEVLDQLAEYMYARGWEGHKSLQKALHSWQAKMMKEAFDEWHKKNVGKYPMWQLDELQSLFYDFIPITNPPKTDNSKD